MTDERERLAAWCDTHANLLRPHSHQEGAVSYGHLKETRKNFEAIARLLRASAPPADVAGLRSERPRAHRAINALRTPDRALATVANTVRQSIAEVIAELLTEVYQAADALAALAQERDRLREALDKLERSIGSYMSPDGWDGDMLAVRSRARAALGDRHE